MARVQHDDPIFFAGTENQFSMDLDPLQWRSVLPGASFHEALSVDPSLRQSFAFGFDQLDALGRQIEEVEGNVALADNVIRSFIANERSEIASVFSQMAAHDIVTSLRGVVGQIAVTVGYTRSVMTDSVRRVYSEPLQGVMQGLSLVNSVFQSQAFQSAMDSITWIPIIGWIINLILGLLTMIAKIADDVRKKRMKKMSLELARRFHLPLIDSDPDMQRASNEAMTRRIMQMAQTYNLEKVFLAPYLVPGGSYQHLEAVAARPEDGGPTYTDEYGNSAQLTTAWYLFGRAGGGAGFVPGGTELIRTLEFYAGQCGAPPRNTGDYMPTAKGMGGFLWQMVLENGPAMFAIDTHYVGRTWDDYVHGLLEYSNACLSRGFTCSMSSYPCSNQEWCGDWNYGGTNCRRQRDRGKKVKIPSSVNHLAEMRNWLVSQFWGRGSNKTNLLYDFRDTNKPYEADNFYYQNTTYAFALKNLRERQMSFLGDYTAMLVTPAKVFEDTYGNEVERARGMFPAVAQDKALEKRWEETVTQIVNDPQLLAEVNYQDIPEYRWQGQSLRQTVRQKQLLQAQQVVRAPIPPPVPGGPSDFPPPLPPSLSGTGLTELAVEPEKTSIAVPKKKPMPRASRVLLGSAIGLTAVAGGAFVYKRVGRKYFT